MKKLETELEASNRWKNRRAMAWISFSYVHALVLYLIIKLPDISNIEGIINTFLILAGSIIGTYIGFATWDDIQKKNAERDIYLKELDNSAAYEVKTPDEEDER